VGGFIVVILLFFLFRWASRVDDDPEKVRERRYKVALSVTGRQGECLLLLSMPRLGC
jgi:hypothetical protein